MSAFWSGDGRRKVVSGRLQSLQATSGSACAGSRRVNRAQTEVRERCFSLCQRSKFCALRVTYKICSLRSTFGSWRLSFPKKTTSERPQRAPSNRCTELARECSIPVYRISHGSIVVMLRRKNLSPQLVAVLCSWWCCSSLEVLLGLVTSDRCISVDREVPQGAPESPLVFVMVADETLGGLTRWERNNFAWTCDEVLLFSRSKASLGAMIEDRCEKFGEAGLEVGLGKTHWSSSVAMDGETLAVRGQSGV